MTENQLARHLANLSRMVVDGVAPAKISAEECRQFILNNIHDDDSLERAIANFSQYSREEMKELHGESGMTREEILSGYVRHRSLILAARNWLENLSL